MIEHRTPRFKVGDRVVFCHLDRMPYPENTMASRVFVVVSHSTDSYRDDLIFFYSLASETPTSDAMSAMSANALVSEDNLMEAPSLSWDQEEI